MKHTISLVFALTLSFLMMFSSMAKAGERETQIIATTSEPNKLELIKVQLEKTNQSYSSPQTQTSSQMLEEEKQMSSNPRTQSCTLDCGGGRLGYWDVQKKQCIPCLK
ncbi:hypothetical protein ACE1CI_05080 [Aerosakkonemataceae cyanobacterium BLCC-F50]|uniref:Uncharacterized protein n=1 Tax=Floridaenema flaviceps BLCC-F50 TaxID=3153642 RepID=A0ABV4XKR5_9CYAN